MIKYYHWGLNLLFALIPISLAIGSFAVNLNLILFLIIGLIYFYKNKTIIKNFKLLFLDKFIIFIFFYFFLVFIINYYEAELSSQKLSEIIILKTILYFKFLIFFFLIRLLNDSKNLKIKWFCVSSALAASFVALNILIQFFFTKDLFGNIPISPRYYSGFFQQELIAGGYLQKFSLFVILLPLFKNNKFIQILLILIFMFAILLSGNRMPFFLFIFTIFIYVFIEKNLKKNLIKILLILFTFLSIFFLTNKNIKYHFSGFFYSAEVIYSVILKNNFEELPKSFFNRAYIPELYCSKFYFNKNPIFGGGIRSFRSHNDACATHPHNYYVEFLVDMGILGFTLMIVFFILVLKNLKLYKNNTYHLNNQLVPFFLIFCAEIFPLRSSGSFFSTNVGVIIFLTLALLIKSTPKNKT